MFGDFQSLKPNPDEHRIQPIEASQLGQQLSERDVLLQRKDREIALREAKIEKINFELARLKRWTDGAKSRGHERRTAQPVRGNAGGKAGRRAA